MEKTLNFKKYQKVVIFGDEDVGKTSIIKRLSGNQLEFHHEKKKGIKSTIVELDDKEDYFNINFIEININDNSSAILDSILYGCGVVLLVFDLANQLSYSKVVNLIHKLEEMKYNDKIFKIIVGNKTDLKDNNRYIEDMKFEKTEIQSLEGADNYEIIEMSTLTNDNLHVLKKFLLGIFVERDNEEETVMVEESEGISKPSSKAERTINIMLLGEPKVGKTSFFGKFFDNDVGNDNYMITVGVDKRSKMIKINQIYYNLQIWDTAGQEVYHSITKSYYKKSDGLILIYDVTDENSFLKVEKWIKDIEANANKETVVFLVGNKIDSVDLRIIEKEKAENVAKSINKKYFEISAKVGINLRETVFAIIKDIIKKKNFETFDPIVIDNHRENGNSGSSCCASSNNNKSSLIKNRQS